MLIIWTDCDREGEYIGYEISQVAKASNYNILIKRARFSVVDYRYSFYGIYFYVFSVVCSRPYVI